MPSNCVTEYFHLDKLGKQARDFRVAGYIDLQPAPTEEIMSEKWKFPLDSRNVETNSRG